MGDSIKNFRKAWQIYNSSQTSRSKEIKAIGEQIEEVLIKHENYNELSDSIKEQSKIFGFNFLDLLQMTPDEQKQVLATAAKNLETMNGLKSQEKETKKSLDEQKAKLKELLDGFVKKYDNNDLIRLVNNYLK